MASGERMEDVPDTDLKAAYSIERFTYYNKQLLPCLHVTIQSATTTTGGNIVSNHHDATGIMIWPATHLLCQHLVVLGTESARLGPGDAVLELGCGCGLVGISAMLMAAHRPSLWVSTDMDDQVLHLCRRNFELNKIPVDQDDAHPVWIRTLRWGDDVRARELLEELQRWNAKSNESRKFDVIVGADIVYPSTAGKTLDDLFRTVDILLTEDGSFWLSFASRDGAKTPSRLIESATEAGFMISCLPPLQDKVTELLPPLLDSKILVLRRSIHAKVHNGNLGAENCSVFPGLRLVQARLGELASEEEWEPPFASLEED